jgi:hypothetical protein
MSRRLKHREDYRVMVRQLFDAMPYEDCGGWRVLSAKDLVSVEIPPPRHGDRWGPWVYQARSRALIHEDVGYPIELDDCTSCAALLDVVFHVSLKAWMSREAIGHLVQALQDLLEPMANLCSCGIDHGPFDAKRWLKARHRGSLC